MHREIVSPGYTVNCWYIDDPSPVPTETHFLHLDEKYYIPHREDGYAYHWKEHTTKREFYQWCVNGKLHRIDGPAYYKYQYKGYSEYWYINGIEIKDPIEIKEWLKTVPPYSEWDDNIKLLFKLRFG